MSYGKVATERQGEIIREIGVPKPSNQPAVEDLAQALVKELQRAGSIFPMGQ
jgi:hypothetical protein